MKKIAERRRPRATLERRPVDQDGFDEARNGRAHGSREKRRITLTEPSPATPPTAQDTASSMWRSRPAARPRRHSTTTRYASARSHPATMPTAVLCLKPRIAVVRNPVKNQRHVSAARPCASAAFQSDEHR